MEYSIIITFLLIVVALCAILRIKSQKTVVKQENTKETSQQKADASLTETVSPAENNTNVKFKNKGFLSRRRKGYTRSKNRFYARYGNIDRGYDPLNMYYLTEWYLDLLDCYDYEDFILDLESDAIDFLPEATKMEKIGDVVYFSNEEGEMIGQIEIDSTNLNNVIVRTNDYTYEMNMGKAIEEIDLDIRMINDDEVIIWNQEKNDWDTKSTNENSSLNESFEDSKNDNNQDVSSLVEDVAIGAAAGVAGAYVVDQILEDDSTETDSTDTVDTVDDVNADTAY